MAALSYKSIPIAFLVVFATVVAPNLQQSAAIRAEGAAASAPSPRRGPIQQQGGFFSDFPCFPWLPKTLRDFCHSMFDWHSPPTECRSELKQKLVSTASCTGYLTNSSVPEPSQACCSDVLSFFDGTTLNFCLCHVANGDIGQLLPAPLNRSRTITVLDECGVFLPPANSIADACIDHPEKYPVPPMDATAPPPTPKKKV